MRPRTHQNHRRAALLRACAALALALAARPGVGSEGDDDPAFKACWAGCQRSGCAQLPGADAPPKDCAVSCPGNGFTPPLALQLTRWGCRADCAYACMWARERQRRHEAGGAAPAVKYFGKWPFSRVLGMQEVASVLFSALNLAAHAHCLRRLLLAASRRAAPAAPAPGGDGGGPASASAVAVAVAAGRPYLWAWVAYAAASVNAWVWSCVFHARDTRATERLDYLLGANLLVATGMLTTVVRVCGLDTPARVAAAAVVVAVGLGRHCHHMLTVKFDYGYNMALCVALGVAQAVAWLVWATRVRHPGRGALYAFAGAVHVAMLLELLDFPPLLALVDAHAAWHAATVPLTYLWYAFVAADVTWAAQEAPSAGTLKGGGGGGGGGVTAKRKQ